METNEEFETFNGVILFTFYKLRVKIASSNVYVDRVYTTEQQGLVDLLNIEDRKDGQERFFDTNLSMLNAVKAPTEIETGEIVGGFAHEQVFALADKVVDAVKSCHCKFCDVGGLDGRAKSRNYYTEFAEKLPKDTVILTVGCANTTQ